MIRALLPIVHFSCVRVLVSGHQASSAVNGSLTVAIQHIRLVIMCNMFVVADGLWEAAVPAQAFASGAVRAGPG